MTLDVFYYKVEFRNSAGVLLGILPVQANINFENVLYSGCGNFTITLARKFDNYYDLVAFGNQVNIYVCGTLYYTGFIQDYTPALQAEEKVEVKGIGFIDQLNWRLLTETDTGELSIIIQGLLTAYTFAYGDITIGTVNVSGLVSDIVSNNTPLKDIFTYMLNLGGWNYVGVNALKQYYAEFNYPLVANAYWNQSRYNEVDWSSVDGSQYSNAWDTSKWDSCLWDCMTVKIHYLTVGDKIISYEPLNSASNVKNSINFTGGRLADGTIFTATFTDPVSIASYGLRETTENNSLITDWTLARQYCSAKLNSYAYSTKRTRIVVQDYLDSQIEAGHLVMVNMPDGSQMQHSVVSSSYDISDDSGVRITIEGDSLLPMWSVNWKQIENNLSNLKQNV